MRILPTSLFAFLFSVISVSAATNIVPVPFPTPGQRPNVVLVSATSSTANSNTATVGKSTNGSVTIANPASMKCTQDGGKSYIQNNTGYCIFAKPFQIVEEWAYFRGEVMRKGDIFQDWSKVF